MALYEIRFHAMGCQMLAAVDVADPRDAETLRQVPQWFEEWEQALSRFRPDSELSRLNRGGGGAAVDGASPVQVSPVLWQVFQAALQAEQRSQGWVTPTIYDALLESGYTQSFESGQPIAGNFSGAATLAAVPSIHAVQVDEARHTLTLPPGVRLDFGGVAKGWAADQALQRLAALGPALVDAGGDVAVGAPLGAGKLWPVGISAPFSGGAETGWAPDGEERDDLLMLQNCGVATSGRDYRRWQVNGVWKHHLIDPHSGLPAQTDVLSATVVAATVAEAEMAAKTALLMGSRAGLDWLNAQSGLAGMLYLEDGRRIYSEAIDPYLWREA